MVQVGGSAYKRIPLEGSTEGIQKQRLFTERRGRDPAPNHRGELLPAQVLKSERGRLVGAVNVQGQSSCQRQGQSRHGASGKKYPYLSLLPPSISCQPLPLAKPSQKGARRPESQGDAENRQRRAENRSGWGGARGRGCCPISQMRKLMLNAEENEGPT